MSQRTHSPSSARKRRGFTLIEILAVGLILGLAAFFVVPNLGSFRRRELRNEGKRVAAHFEFARQRAVVTGATHRVWLDLDGGFYRLEWLAADAEADAPQYDGPTEYDVRGETPLPLEAPTQAAGSFQPIPGLFGNVIALSPEVAFVGVETPEGLISRGETWVVFERDGTASESEILLDDRSGIQLALEVLPLADIVRIHYAD